MCAKFFYEYVLFDDSLLLWLYLLRCVNQQQHYLFI